MEGIDSVRGVRRRALLLTALAAAALAACSGGDDDETADPTVPTAVSTVPPTTGQADVATIPEVIDEPYLNRVLAALDEVDGQATRIIVARKDFVPEAGELLASIYRGEEFEEQAETWLDILDRDPALAGIRPNPGNRKSTVDRLVSSSRACVWMAVKRDYADTAATPPPPRTEYVALRPKEASDDVRKRNPTAWVIVDDGFTEDGSEPGNQCAAS